MIEWSDDELRYVQWELQRLTENWDGIRRWWQCLTNYQQKDDERQQNCDFEIDFFSGLDWQEETKEGDGVDEEAGKDEVDNVEQTATRHVDGESDVRVRFGTAGVYLTQKHVHVIRHYIYGAVENNNLYSLLSKYVHCYWNTSAQNKSFDSNLKQRWQQ